MKFVMSYSCGKDSTLALHHMITQGHEPIALLTMFNEDAERTFFHGADRNMLEAYAEALQLPLLLTPAKGENYHLEMEKSLRKAVELGAEAACFGDIDLEANRAWCEERCRNTGLKAIFPLWQRDRAENVREIVNLGYRCMIKSLNHTLLPQSLLGSIIDEAVMEKMENCGIDICGENGEYHTLVMDGPIFHTPIPYRTGEILEVGDFSIITVDVPL